MSSLNEKEKKLSEKQLAVANADFDLDVVKDVYDVKLDNTAKDIVSELEKNQAVKDYMYTKAQVQAVETELYMNAVMSKGKDDNGDFNPTVKQKAIDSFLDRVKGKPMQKTDLTTNGKDLPTVINIIAPK